MTFTASDVLLKAASRIEEEGMWCQRQGYEWNVLKRLGIDPLLDEEVLAIELYERQLRVPECAIGAIGSVVVELTGAWNNELIGSAIQAINPEDNCYYVWMFNDAEGRTAHEVAEAMRRAAL